MKLVVEGKDHFELARNLPKVIDPRDFASDAISYFTFLQLTETSYQIQKVDKFYQDEMLFMEEVSGKIAGGQIYGFVSGMNNEITLGFRGLRFIVEYEYVGGRWILREFDDFNLRKESIAERRFKINSGFSNLKKLLS